MGQGGSWGASLAIAIALFGGALAAHPANPSTGLPGLATTATIRVDEGTNVTIWERTTDTNVLTYSVATLTGPGGTFDSLAAEHYTFTSDGLYLKIHCFRDAHGNGTGTGNNIAAARLDGVPGYPSGLWATIIVSYILGYGGIESSRFEALGSNLSTITFMGDQHSELVLGYTVERANSAPVITSVTSTPPKEGTPVTFTAVASDPDGDALVYRWDFDSDGTWDSGWSSDPSAAYTWGDDWKGTVRVAVSDGALITTADVPLVVPNVNPALTALLMNVTAGPDCGDEHGEHDRDHGHDDGCGCGDHDEHGDHDEGGCGGSVTFRATARDPGSDDLTFSWDFGDGTRASRTYYNNGVGPDPHPSPGGVFPVSVTNGTTHVYATGGNFTVTLNITDDDGGIVTVVRHVVVCAGDDDELGNHHGDHEHEDDGCGHREHDDDHDDSDGDRNRCEAGGDGMVGRRDLSPGCDRYDSETGLTASAGEREGEGRGSARVDASPCRPSKGP